MTARARALRLVALGVVLAGGGGIVLALSRDAAPAEPAAAPSPVVTASAEPSASPAAPEPEPEPTVEPKVDPASVFVEEDFEELEPVALDERADYGNDVTVTLDELERVDGVGAGPGEVAGPAVLVQVTLHNDSEDEVDLGAVVVDLYSAQGRLGTPLYGDERSEPFEGVAKAGKKVTATYVVRVPDDSPEIKLTVSYEAETPAVTFFGEV